MDIKLSNDGTADTTNTRIDEGSTLIVRSNGKDNHADVSHVVMEGNSTVICCAGSDIDVERILKEAKRKAYGQVNNNK